MCGVAGIVSLRVRDRLESRAQLSRMLSALGHRGPDAQGTWEDPSLPVFLGHTRLSIIDLSAEGAQPMQSPSGRYVLSYNGEIYNSEEIRAELDRERTWPWRGHSDTEVLLAAIQRWGIRAAVEKLNGMFAFALWDRDERTLWLARDRCGEKPLYYWHSHSQLIFASDLSSISAVWGRSLTISSTAVQAYFARSYVPSPLSIFEEVKKIEPATLMAVRVQDGSIREPSTARYWDVAEIAERSAGHRYVGSRSDALNELDQKLARAVKMRMASDVPLGAFLSGGIDSSTIVALMQRQSSNPIRTFSIASEQEDINEAGYARAVAEHLGTEHQELLVSSEEARSVVPRLPFIYDEPFADPSQIPTFLVSQLARKAVTVALSGDGGDEVFGGYHRYAWTSRLWRACRPFPTWSRQALRKAALAISPKRWHAIGSAASTIARLPRHTMLGDRVHKLAGVIDAASAEEIYLRLVTCWPVSEVFAGATVAPQPAARQDQSRTSVEEWMMVNDTLSYLPDDVLVKVDRASMAVSLEARAPFLDHDVIEFAWSLPQPWKIGHQSGKLILKELLYTLVPKALVDRPKTGFGVPLADWLRRELKEWMCDLVNQRAVEQHGLFLWEPVRRAMAEHLSGNANRAYQLWTVLMFQAWYEHQKTQASLL